MDSPKVKYDSPEQRAALFDAINKNCGVNDEGQIYLDKLLNFIKEEIEVKFVDSQALILHLTNSLQLGANNGSIAFEDVCRIFRSWLEKQTSISQFKIVKPTSHSFGEILCTPSNPMASSTPYTLRKEFSLISHDSSIKEETFYSACDSCGRDGSCCELRSEVKRSSSEENLKKYYDQKLEDAHKLLEESEECNSVLQHEVESLKEAINILKNREQRWIRKEYQLVDREHQLSKLNNLLNEQKTAVDKEVQRLNQQVSRLKTENESLLSQCILLEESKINQQKVEKMLSETKAKVAKIEVELHEKDSLLEMREEKILQLHLKNEELHETISTFEMLVRSKTEMADHPTDPLLDASDESPEQTRIIGNYFKIYPHDSSESMTLKEELLAYVDVKLGPCVNISTQTMEVQYECVSTQTANFDSSENIPAQTKNTLSSNNILSPAMSPATKNNTSGGSVKFVHVSTQISHSLTMNKSTQSSPILSSSHVHTDELIESKSQTNEGRLVRDYCAQFQCSESENNAQNRDNDVSFFKEQPTERCEIDSYEMNFLENSESIISSPSHGACIISKRFCFKNVDTQSSQPPKRDSKLFDIDAQTENAPLYCTTYEIPIFVMEDVSTQVDSFMIESARKNESATQTDKTDIWNSEVPIPAPRAVQHVSYDPLTAPSAELQQDDPEQSEEAAVQETHDLSETEEEVVEGPTSSGATDNLEEAASSVFPFPLPMKASLDSNKSSNAAHNSGRAQCTVTLLQPTHGSTPRSTRAGTSYRERNDLGKPPFRGYTSDRIELGFGILNNDGDPVLFFPDSSRRVMNSSNVLLAHELQLNKSPSHVSDDSPENQRDSGRETSQEIFSETEGAFARGFEADHGARRRERAGCVARVAEEAALGEPPERARRRRSDPYSSDPVSPRRFELLWKQDQPKESSDILRITETETFTSTNVQTLVLPCSGSSEELFISAEIGKTSHDSSTSLESNGEFPTTSGMDSTDSLTYESFGSSCNIASGTYSFSKVKFQKRSNKMHNTVFNTTIESGRRTKKYTEYSSVAESVGIQTLSVSRIFLRIATLIVLSAGAWFYYAFTSPPDGIVYHSLPCTMDRLRELFTIKYVYPYGSPPV